MGVSDFNPKKTGLKLDNSVKSDVNTRTGIVTAPISFPKESKATSEKSLRIEGVPLSTKVMNEGETNMPTSITGGSKIISEPPKLKPEAVPEVAADKGVPAELPIVAGSTTEVSEDEKVRPGI